MADDQSSNAARIVVADEHPAVRGAVRLASGPGSGLEVVGEATTAEELVERVKSLSPDAVVTDLEFPDGDGLDVVRDLRRSGFEGAIVILTDRTDGEVVLEALRLGVEAYLVKASGLRTIGLSIERVLAGERLVAPELERVAVLELGRFVRQAREGSEVRAMLSPREQEILVLISQGLTMRQIATRLEISPRTVETHMAKLYRKLAVRTRVQAVARAASLGLIELR